MGNKIISYNISCNIIALQVAEQMLLVLHLVRNKFSLLHKVEVVVIQARIQDLQEGVTHVLCASWPLKTLKVIIYIITDLFLSGEP